MKLWLISLFYELEQLEYLCIFDSEQKRFARTFLTKRNLGRFVFVSLLVPLIPGWFHLYGWGQFEEKLTNWGMVFVIANLIISVLMPYSKNYRKKPLLMAVNHAIFSIAIILQVIGTFYFWAMVGTDVVKKNRHNKLAVIYQYTAHTMPTLACLYNFIITDFLFYRRHARISFVITFLLLATNYA